MSIDFLRSKCVHAVKASGNRASPSCPGKSYHKISKRLGSLVEFGFFSLRVNTCNVLCSKSHDIVHRPGAPRLYQYILNTDITLCYNVVFYASSYFP